MMEQNRQYLENLQAEAVAVSTVEESQRGIEEETGEKPGVY